LDKVTSLGYVVVVESGAVVVAGRQRLGWRAVELLDRIVQSKWPEADLVGAELLCTKYEGCRWRSIMMSLT
jgi:hypothetical protein